MKNTARRSLFNLLDNGLLTPISLQINETAFLSFTPSHELDSVYAKTEHTAYMYLLDFYHWCHELQLPVHNPIAFFHSLYNKSATIRHNPKMKEYACQLLQMVFADCHFLLGSAFDATEVGREALRAADLYWIAQEVACESPSGQPTDPFCLHYESDEDEGDTVGDNLIDRALQFQSVRNSARRFVEDYPLFTYQFQKLCNRKVQYLYWKQCMGTDNSGEPFRLNRRICLKFWAIYQEFSLRQCTDNTRMCKQELNELQKNLQTALVIFRLCSAIHRILKSNRLIKYAPWISKVLSGFFKKHRIQVQYLIEAVPKKNEDLQEVLQKFLTAVQTNDSDGDYPWFIKGKYSGWNGYT